MPARSAVAPTPAARNGPPIHPDPEHRPPTDRPARDLDPAVQPDRALSLIALGLLRRITVEGGEPDWRWRAGDDGTHSGFRESFRDGFRRRL